MDEHHQVVLAIARHIRTKASRSAALAWRVIFWNSDGMSAAEIFKELESLPRPE